MTAGAYGHWTSILYFVVSIYALVCAISLLYNAYNSVIIAFIFGIFLIVPCINFLVLLCASLKATKILKEAGYKVGLLGADMNQFD